MDYIKQIFNEKDPNKTIHCLFYCINSNRFEDIESQVLLSLRKRYKNGISPIIIAYTRNYFEDNWTNEKYINDKLKEHHETEIDDKVEDINLVGFVAEKKVTKIFGLNKLLNYLKLKAKRAFFIATINMVKQCCLEIVEILVNDTYNQLLSNLGDILSSGKYGGILYP